MTEGLSASICAGNPSPESGNGIGATLAIHRGHTDTTYALSQKVREALGLKDGESLKEGLTISAVAEKLTDARIGHGEMKKAFQHFFPDSGKDDHDDAIMGAAHSQPRHEPPPVRRPYQHETSRHS